MSKPIKNLIVETYRRKFDGIDGAVVVDLRGVSANNNNALRGGLAKDGIRITVVKNSLARKAFVDTVLDSVNELLDGPCALAYGGGEVSVVNVARALIDKVKGLENVSFKGAVMEGVVFGPDQVEALSKYPTREEAQAQVIQVILAAAGSLIGAITGAGGAIGGILKAIEEKLEGEAEDATVKSLG